MKPRTTFPGWLVFTALLLVGCASSAAPNSGQVIEPGTTLGEMTLRKASDETEMGETMWWWQYCDKVDSETDPGPYTRECTTPHFPLLFIGDGIEADSAEAIDLLWSSRTWEMEFDGNPVDLPAFGVLEFDLEGSTLRFWNIVIDAPTTGEHTVRYVTHDAESGKLLRDVTYTITVQ